MKNHIIKLAILFIIGLMSVSISAQDIAAISSAHVDQSYAYAHKTDDTYLITTNAIGEIKKHIGKHLDYPIIAQENNIEGVVLLAVQIDEKGSIVSSDIKSEKNNIMDKAVLKSIDKLKKVSPIYVSGTAKNYTVMIPVRFQTTTK